MAAIQFENLYSTEIKSDGLHVTAVDGRGNGYTFVIAKRMIDPLILALHSAKNSLASEEITISMGAHPIVSQSGIPGVELVIGENLRVPVLLGQIGLDGLRACIDQLQNTQKDQPPPSLN